MQGRVSGNLIQMRKEFSFKSALRINLEELIEIYLGKLNVNY
jgi:hypothetical protein